MKDLATQPNFRVGDRVRIVGNRTDSSLPALTGVIDELRPVNGGALVKLDQDGVCYGWGWNEMELIDGSTTQAD